MVFGVLLIIISILLYYCFAAYMIGLPLVFNILGESSPLFYMSAQLGVKWSFILATAGLVLGVAEIITHKKNTDAKVNKVSVLYFVAEIIILLAIII